MHGYIIKEGNSSTVVVSSREDLYKALATYLKDTYDCNDGEIQRHLSYTFYGEKSGCFSCMNFKGTVEIVEATTC